MKKILAMLLVSLASGVAASAQCNKNVTWTASKIEYVDPLGTLQHTDTGKTILQIKDKQLTLRMENDADKTVTGPIKQQSCNWKTPYKTGTMELQTELFKATGESRHANITIEATDGKTVIWVAIENTGGAKMKLVPDTFTEN